MVIAGLLNQSKRILQKYDEILYGSSPELLIGPTHKAIRDLLRSEDARRFVGGKQEVEDGVEPGYVTFAKRIIEAVKPIIPITLRNK